jgi:WD40-like Beta Propeller Repeat
VGYSNNDGFKDGYLVKFDSNGNILPTADVNLEDSQINDIDFDPTTNRLYVGGWTISSLDGQPNLPQSGQQAFVASYDTGGNRLDVRVLRTDQDDSVTAVDVDNSGNVHIIGMTGGAIDGNESVGAIDVFVAQYDANLEKNWSRQFGTAGRESTRGIQVDKNGTVYVTGQFEEGVNVGSWDGFFTAFDRDGNRADWTEMISQPSWDYFGQMAFDKDDNLFIAGVASGSVDGQLYAGSLDPLVMKYDFSQTYTANTSLDLKDIVVRDDDGHPVEVSLALSNPNSGQLTTGTFGSVTSTFANGVWRASGAAEDINALLENVQFIPAQNFVETVAIEVSVTDNIAPAVVSLMTIDRALIERISLDSNGNPGNDNSFWSSISGDGRYVAFESWASNLVSSDTNNQMDIFVRDRQTGQIERVNLANDGTQSNMASFGPNISANGRFVGFYTGASNLVANDTNGTGDAFVRDLQTRQTIRISVASDGTQGNGISQDPSLSADGRYVSFWSTSSNLVSGDTNNQKDIFVRDLQTGQTERVSMAFDGGQANGESHWSSISADGRYVVFESIASNLVPGDTNGVKDLFVRDLVTDQTTRISVASDGTQGNGESGDRAIISADGRYVAFHSTASNLVPGDTNNLRDVFVRDLATNQTTRVSVASDGTQANSDSDDPAISADGRYITFDSGASNLVANDTNNVRDIFRHDIITGQTIRVSVTSDRTQANNMSDWLSSISEDGRYVSFHSSATNLVEGDTNGQWDVFLIDTAKL